MRRGVIAVMSGLSLAVSAVSYHHGERGHLLTSPLGLSGGVVPGGVVPGGVVSGGAVPGRVGPSASGRRATSRTTPQPGNGPATPSAPQHGTPSATAASDPTAAGAATRTATQATAAKPSSTPPPPPPPPPTPKTVTVNGGAADTPYGPVQVQLTIRGGTIVRAVAISYPNSGGLDHAINGHAIPLLNQETLQRQSARIDAVSGASYTSQAYVGSLQSAIDAAHKAGAL